MKHSNHYYLFKAGKITGPLNHEKVEGMRASGDLLKYSWMIDEETQKWQPIDTIPNENPFTATKEVLGEREISGSFFYMKKPYLGTVKGIHSFGLELLVDHDVSRISGMSPNTVLHLNLVDETNEQWVNTQVSFQSQESSKQGTLLRFGWVSGPAKI
jgi:hypothetical protein